MFNNNKHPDIKFGQVWRATRDFRISIYSPQKACIIPKGTKIVVLHTPINGAIVFNIMPLISKGLDERLVPNLKNMETKKEGFGVLVNIEYFKRWFVLDENQKVEFDNKDAADFWRNIITVRNKKRGHYD